MRALNYCYQIRFDSQDRHRHRSFCGVPVSQRGSPRLVKWAELLCGRYVRLLFSLTALTYVMHGMAALEQGVPVSIAPIQEQPIFRTLQLTGTVTSPRVATLSTATSGLVTAIYADEGVRIAAGDLLLELDSVLAELQWQSTIAKVEQARSALQDVERRLQEARTLSPQRSIAESVVRSLESEALEDQAVLQQMTAEANYQQEILKRHKLKAPFDGILSKKLAEIGEWVSPGDSIFELVATSNLRLDFAVAEDYLAQIGSDATVTFRLNADPKTVYQGRIGTIVPVMDSSARTFLLRVTVDDIHRKILPGMSVNATLQIPSERQGMVAPKDAIVRYPDGRIIVWTVASGANGLVAEERSIRMGASFDGFVEILEGLSRDAKVVIQGNESLQNGQRVYLATPQLPVSRSLP